MQTLSAGILILILAAHGTHAQQRPAPPPRDAEPALSLDALDKFRDLARASTKRGSIAADVADLLDPDAGSCPSRQLVAQHGGATHYMAFCLPWENDEIFLFAVRAGGTDLYRMDSAPSLRSAARITATGTQRLPRDQAADAFQRELAVWEELSGMRVRDTAAAFTISFLRNAQR